MPESSVSLVHMCESVFLRVDHVLHLCVCGRFGVMRVCIHFSLCVLPTPAVCVCVCNAMMSRGKVNMVSMSSFFAPRFTQSFPAEVTSRVRDKVLRFTLSDRL